MSRALTVADTADFSLGLEGFSGIPGIGFSMFGDMSKADTWQSLSDLTTRIACRLTALREAQNFAENKGAAAPERGGESAAARFPAGRDDNRGMNGVWPRVTQSQREASADVFGCAMHASGEI